MDNMTPGSAIASITRQKAIQAADDAGRPIPTESELQALVAEAERKATFGWDWATRADKHGNPTQNGIGAPGFETLNHFSSIRRYQGEAKYQQAVRAMWKNFPDRARLIGLEQPERLGS